MRDNMSLDCWAFSPRAQTPSRPRSVREVYKPAVQDLSEQAACYGSSNQYDDGILSVVSSCTPRQSSCSVSSPNYDKFYSPTPLINHLSPEETIKSSTINHLSVNQHNPEYHEDLHRQRVLVSAHQRRQLNPRLRRSRSTPAAVMRSQSAVPDPDRYRNTWQTTDVEADKLELVVTNGYNANEKDCTERVNYRLMSRVKPKSAHVGLMANGSPLPVLNGYSQTLLSTFPQYSQKYCKWLTNGFKVQSFRTGHHHQRYNHARLPPPLLQYINRPKTVSGVRTLPTKARTKIDMNIVGVQKEVSSTEKT